MNPKPWYRQRTLYAGAALVITGIGQLVTGESILDGIVTIAEGVGLIFARQAINLVAAQRTQPPQ
jgi:hypothetical protein